MSNTDPTQRRIGQIMLYAAWALFLGLLTLFFSDYLERQDNPNRDPASRTSDGIREVVLQRNRHGHYVATGRINGQPATLLLDTGASLVSVPVALARRLGLDYGPPLQARTANGVITVYATVLERVAVGDIVVRNVRASINPADDGEVVLLGMTFMRDLEISQRGRELTLRQY